MDSIIHITDTRISRIITYLLYCLKWWWKYRWCWLYITSYLASFTGRKNEGRDLMNAQTVISSSSSSETKIIFWGAVLKLSLDWTYLKMFFILFNLLKGVMKQFNFRNQLSLWKWNDSLWKTNFVTKWGPGFRIRSDIDRIRIQPLSQDKPDPDPNPDTWKLSNYFMMIFNKK